MTTAAERMRAMRERKRARGLREVRIIVPTRARRLFGEGWPIRSPVSINAAKRTPCVGSRRLPSLTHLSFSETMRRGDVVIGAVSGDYGEPRPAVIVQTDAFPATHASVVICQLTSETSDAPDLRITINPTAQNGLRSRSQVMADKPVTVGECISVRRLAVSVRRRLDG